VGWLVFDNPERHNTLTLDMAAGINKAVDVFNADDHVKVVTMRGNGTAAFMSGADIRQLGEWAHDDGVDVRPPWDALNNLTKPLLAMIYGWCLGGGVNVAICADIRIAADDAVFGIPAARLGAGYPYDSVEALVRLVGPATTSELLFTGERINAQEAHRVGLINRVVPKDALDATVASLAATIASNAPLTIRAAKTAIRDAVTDPGNRNLQNCQRLVDQCMHSDDFAEGLRAFAEKRQPHFTGR
jgi:enoyl-CoA hydratase